MQVVNEEDNKAPAVRRPRSNACGFGCARGGRQLFLLAGCACGHALEERNGHGLSVNPQLKLLRL